MNGEQGKKRTTVSRDDLHRQVWQTPMIRLGEQYGISGNGLKKICNRLKIPYPPPGYWAKLAAGRQLKQTPLPNADSDTPNEVKITPTPPPPARPSLAPHVAEQLEKAKVSAMHIKVPDNLRQPHPIIAAWIAEHGRRVAEARRDQIRWGSSYKPEQLSQLVRRQQRILSALFKEMEKRGFKVRGEAPYNVYLEIGHNKVEYSLRERIRQVRRPVTDKERAGPFYRNQEWRQERVPTGELLFAIKACLTAGLTTEWRDGECSLEEQLPDIVAVLSVAGPILEKHRLEAEAAERRRWEEQQKREEERARKQQDQNRWRRFLELANRWEEAALAKRFIAVLEQLPPEPQHSYDGRTASEWLAWARERYQDFDPTAGGAGEIWSNLASVTSWEYPHNR